MRWEACWAASEGGACVKYPWIDEYLLSKPGVTKNNENWNWDRYMIGGKMFAAV